MSKTLEEIILWLFAAVILALGTLGIRGCVANDRVVDAACRARGGMMTSVGMSHGCFKVTAEPLDVPK